jgi:hypothetical protein
VLTLLAISVYVDAGTEKGIIKKGDRKDIESQVRTQERRLLERVLDGFPQAGVSPADTSG